MHACVQVLACSGDVYYEASSFCAPYSSPVQHVLYLLVRLVPLLQTRNGVKHREVGLPDTGVCGYGSLRLACPRPGVGRLSGVFSICS